MKPISDGDVIEECTEKLDRANVLYEKLEKYFKGEQPLAYLTEDVRKACGDRLTPLHIDWPRLIINSHEQRCDVEDFRLGNQEVFKPAFDIWQRNNMDAKAPMAHSDAFLYGLSFESVWLRNGKATMNVESARQVWCEHDPADPSLLRYGLKRWFDPRAGRGFLRILLPDGKMNLYQTHAKSDEDINYHGMSADITNLPVDSWDLLSGESLTNTTGRLPFFPVINRGRILNPYGESQLTEVLPIADAVNKMATDMMVSGEFHAGPRRWATGVETVEDEHGETQEAFSQLRGRTWTAEDPAARIGSLPEADLANFIGAIGMLDTILAAMGGIPPHYVDSTKGSLASADSIRAASEPLVAGARRFMTVGAGPAHEDAMRYALELEGVQISPEIEKMEVRWRDPENRTMNQIVDAAIKRKAVGVPLYQLWEDMGYTATQIKRMKRMEKEEKKNAQDAGSNPTDPNSIDPASGPGAVPALKPPATNRPAVA